ncbi:Uncharacterised protein [Ewingella americana]|uniref:Uncharacterized protein n=1 Tax=Ewingella americana TaxID=41202 RepID=A0A377N8N6_9GAMM|nr:Uncharacterised protein [Ewingella americana]
MTVPVRRIKARFSAANTIPPPVATTVWGSAGAFKRLSFTTAEAFPAFALNNFSHAEFGGLQQIAIGIHKFKAQRPAPARCPTVVLPAPRAPIMKMG